MAETSLKTIIGGTPAGTLTQDEAGLINFRYAEDYQGVPLSLSMPISNRTYTQETLLPYLFGLLPDSERQRRAIALEFGVRPNNPVALLTHIGRDCPGGVQFCREEDLGAALDRTGAYGPISEHDIARRLSSIRQDETVSWMGGEESWSLGGNQGKFALGFYDGTWCECIGAAATTHIFKNGVVGFRLQALNEYVCMKTAARSGISTAAVEYRFFEDEPALIVSRYDRVLDASGNIARLHQEDFCQALGVMPNQKYTADGGPTTHDALRLLCSTKNAHLNLLLFTQILFYNCLIGAPDAHAKNYSLILGRGRNAAVAPMYDVASGLAYENLRRKGRLAMAIGGENRFGRVGSDAIHRYMGGNDPALAAMLEKAEFTEAACTAIMADLAQEIPVSMAEVFDEAEANGIPGAAELRERMLGAVCENCAKTLALL